MLRPVSPHSSENPGNRECANTGVVWKVGRGRVTTLGMKTSEKLLEECSLQNLM